MSHYTIGLEKGKYLIVNWHDGPVTLGRYEERWNPGEQYLGLIRAMADRIEHLEMAVKDVLSGSRLGPRYRDDNGMKDFGIEKLHLVAEWEHTLTKVLEQK